MNEKLPVAKKIKPLEAVKPSGLSASKGDEARRDEDTRNEEKLHAAYLAAESELERLHRAHAGGMAAEREIINAQKMVAETWARYLAAKERSLPNAKRKKAVKKSADVHLIWDDEGLTITALGTVAAGPFTDALEKALHSIKAPSMGKIGNPHFFLNKHQRGLYILWVKMGLRLLRRIEAAVERTLRGIKVKEVEVKKSSNLLRFPLEKAIKPLTPSQADALVQEVLDNSYAFAVNFSGWVPDKAVMKRLKAKGLVAETTFSFPANAYAMQRVIDVLETAGRDTAKVSFAKMLSMAQKVPLTRFEKDQIAYLERSAAARVTGLGEGIAASLRGTAEAGSQIQRYRGLIKETAKEGVLNRWGWQNLSSELGRRTGDWARDWDRIARTELQNAQIDSTVAKVIRDNKGEDPLVYKRPRMDACRYCMELYTRDGNPEHPRVFRLSALIANGTNVGRKVGAWKPTKDTAHPNCSCVLGEYVGTVSGEMTTGPYGDIEAEHYDLYGVVPSKKTDAHMAELLSQVKITVDGIPIEEFGKS